MYSCRNTITVQEVNDALGGFGPSVAEVKKKWMYRVSHMKEQEAAVERPNESSAKSRLKTGGRISNATEVSAVDSRNIQWY